MEDKIALFTADDITLEVPVSIEQETVWLNRQQMSKLFDRDVKTIGKHIANALAEELSENLEFSVVANFATTAADGKTYQVEYYNLDMILSVGYRVKSKRGIAFRRWANSILKQYIMKGYVVNDRRLEQLGQVIEILRRSEKSLDSKQVLDVIGRYTNALNLLDDYDHQTMKRPTGENATYILTYEECRKIIDGMKFAQTSELFGNEKDDSFKGSIGNIYQTFGGKDVYPSAREKAANLLYFVTKNHSFSDGNKRIAAAMFLHFLNRNNLLFDANDNKIISDFTLVALTIMIAESKPEEKEMMVSVVMNCMGKCD